ncbi:MAG: hypothetical protein AAF989_08745 [Planctomycetota bacterium]
MATTESTAHVPTMNAETGYGVEESPPPIRVSGFVALIFGLASVFCLLGRPLLFLPVIGFVLGLFALRPSEMGKPVGTLAARVGMLLSVGLGVCGFLMPFLAQRSVGTEAGYFAKQYLTLVARGEKHMAMYLRVDHINRVSNEVSVIDHYEKVNSDMLAKAERETQSPFELYLADPGVESLQDIGGDVELYQTQQPVLYKKYDEPFVYTYWNNSNKPFGNDLIVIMSYKIDSESGRRQWYVDSCRFDE